MRKELVLSISVLLTFLAPSTMLRHCNAQLLNSSVPMQQLSDSYHNNLSTSWGLQGPNWFFNFPGSAGGSAFGGANQNAGLSGGFAGRSGSVSGNFGFQWSQGSQRSNSVVTPSVTTMDGQPGSIFSGTVRPFVVGITPVVGANEAIRNLGQQRQAATLQSIAEKKAKSRSNKALEYWERGQKAEHDGNLRMARANYRLALGKADGELRLEILNRMAKHGWTR